MSLNLDKSRWTRLRFGDAVRNVNDTVRDLESSGIDRVIAMEHMDPGNLSISRWGILEDGTSFSRRVKPGQTLFGKRRAYQRKVAFAEFDAICSGDILTFEADESKMLAEFLPFLVQSDAFFDHALGTSAGSLSPRTNWRDLAKFEFDLPPFDEQRRIAELLWLLDKNRISEINTANHIESVIQRFCVKVFDESSINYPLTTFDACGALTMGRQKSPKYRTGQHGMPYLRVANIGPLQLDLANLEEMDFDERDRDKYKLVKGDVLLTEGDIVSPLNVGRSAVYDGDATECAFQNTLIRFRPLHGSDSHFFTALFEGMRLRGVFAGAASTTTVTHLGLKRLSKVPLPGVPRDVQLTVGDVLRSLLEARSRYVATQASVDDLRASLLDEVFGTR